jgi:hypothetical protein
VEFAGACWGVSNIKASEQVGRCKPAEARRSEANVRQGSLVIYLIKDDMKELDGEV